MLWDVNTGHACTSLIRNVVFEREARECLSLFFFLIYLLTQPTLLSSLSLFSYPPLVILPLKSYEIINPRFALEHRYNKFVSHSLHVDADDLWWIRHDDQERPSCSIKTAVVYLTAPGAFTAITAHKKYDGDRDFDPSLWLSKPEIGSVLVFPGSNVHGVLPILRDRFDNTERVRLTLNFAFWVDRPCVFGNIVTQNDTYVEQSLTHSLERKPQP